MDWTQPVAELTKTIPAANVLGECVIWDGEHGHVLWTDILGKTLYVHDPATEVTEGIGLLEELCAFGFLNGSDDLLCAFRSGFAILNRFTGSTSWLHRIEDSSEVRLNDGRVDRQGRFWCGSMIDNEGNASQNGSSGHLYCVAHDGTVTRHLDGIRISNSICWSPDSEVMYFADSALGVIWAFDFDTDAGSVSNRRVFARTPAGTGPDGSTVDSEGFLWNAEWGRGRVVRYAPNGDTDLVLQLPVSHVSCVTFGGETLSDLYVTSATDGLTDSQRAAEPEAGDVFVFSTEYRGLPECRFMHKVSRPG